MCLTHVIFGKKTIFMPINFEAASRRRAIGYRRQVQLLIITLVGWSVILKYAAKKSIETFNYINYFTNYTP